MDDFGDKLEGGGGDFGLGSFFYLETESFNLLRVEIWECYLGPEQATLALLWINHWACSVAKLCLTLCEPMDRSPPGSSVHGIFQTRILEWVAISYSRGSSQPRDLTHIS